MKYLIGILLVAILFVNCKDKPFPLSPDETHLVFENIQKTEKAIQFSFQDTVMYTGASSSILVGEKGGYETRMLLKFDTVATSVYNTLDSVSIQLYRSGSIAESEKDFNLLLYPLTGTNHDWVKKKLRNYDDVIWNTTPELARVTNVSNEDDTIRFVIKDVEFIKQQWSDSVNNHGVWIKAENADDIIRYYSYNAVSYNPTMTYYFKNSSEENKRDSTTVMAIHDLFLIKKKVNDDPYYVYVGKGYSARTYFIFEADSIQKVADSLATVNYAKFDMYYDPEKSLVQETDDYSEISNMLLIRFQANTLDFDSVLVDSLITGYYSTQPTVDKENNCISFKVTNILQSWVSRENKSKYYGFKAQFLSEDNSLAKVAIYPSENKEYQSRLSIICTEPPTDTE